MAGFALGSVPNWSGALRCRQATHGSSAGGALIQQIDVPRYADWRGRFWRQVAATLDGPVFGPRHEDRADEPEDGNIVQK